MKKIIFMLLLVLFLGNIRVVEARSLKIMKEPTEDTSLSLAGALFAVYYYDTDEYVGTFETNQEGIIYIPEVANDKDIMFFELEAPYGFLRNTGVSRAMKNDIDLLASSICFPIKKNVIFNGEPNLVIEIENNKDGSLKEVVLNQEGIGNIDLQYGEYSLKFGNDYKNSKIVIDDETEPDLKVDLESYKTNGSLNVALNDSESQLQFKIKNVDTNQYLVIDNNDTFKINLGSLKVSNIPYGKYKLEVVLDKQDYDIANKSLEFIISENSEEAVMKIDVLPAMNDDKSSSVELDKVLEETIKDEVITSGEENKKEDNLIKESEDINKNENKFNLDNTREEIVVPITGQYKSSKLLEISLFLMVASIFIYDKQKKIN